VTNCSEGTGGVGFTTGGRGRGGVRVRVETEGVGGVRFVVQGSVAERGGGDKGGGLSVWVTLARWVGLSSGSLFRQGGVH
jgi:hypothetical protein